MTGSLRATPIALPPIPPMYDCQPTSSHITLQYRVEASDWQHLVGQHFIAEVLAECWNSRAQALLVNIPSNIPCRGQHPHITVSWSPSGQPYDSVAMLSGQHESQLLVWPPILCRIDWHEWNEPKPLPSWHPCPTCWGQGKFQAIRGKWCKSHRPSPSRRDASVPDLGWQVSAAKVGNGWRWWLYGAAGAIVAEGAEGTRKKALDAGWARALQLELAVKSRI